MPETEESKGKTLFRRWKGERFSEHRVKRVKGLFTQAVIWLGLLAVLFRRLQPDCISAGAVFFQRGLS